MARPRGRARRERRSRRQGWPELNFWALLLASIFVTRVEGHLEAPFEFLHLMRHGRLRQVQFLCRRSETAAFNHFDD